MNKNILAIAIAAAVAAPSAFAAATVYGVAHVGASVNSGVNGASATGTDSSTTVNSNSSRLGIKGDEDLGGGMKAVYQMEFGIGMEGEGSQTTSANTLRNTFAGIGGGFGTVLVGRHDSPMKLVGRQFDLFGDQVGNNRNILGGAETQYVDGRHSNVLAYATPSFGGFSALIAYVPGAIGAAAGTLSDDERNSGDTSKGDAFSAMLGYKAGALEASLGVITADTKVITGAAKNNYTGYRLGAGYTFGAAKIVGLYQQTNVNEVLGGKDARQVYGLGGSYQVSAAGTIKGQYYVANELDNAKNGGSMITVGYDHAMTKNTTAYAAYALADNQSAGVYSVNASNSGSSDNFTAVAGKDNSAFSVGLIHKF